MTRSLMTWPCTRFLAISESSYPPLTSILLKNFKKLFKEQSLQPDILAFYQLSLAWSEKTCSCLVLQAVLVDMKKVLQRIEAVMGVFPVLQALLIHPSIASLRSPRWVLTTTLQRGPLRVHFSKYLYLSKISLAYPKLFLRMRSLFYHLLT